MVAHAAGAPAPAYAKWVGVRLMRANTHGEGPPSLAMGPIPIRAEFV